MPEPILLSPGRTVATAFLTFFAPPCAVCAFGAYSLSSDAAAAWRG